MSDPSGLASGRPRRARRPGPVDVHCHVLPEGLRPRGAASWRDPWFRLCQAQARFASGDEVMAALDAGGIQRGVIFGWPFRDPGLLAEVNDYVAGEAARSGGRLLGLALINPGRPGIEAELARCRALGLVGVGELNADAQGFELEHKGGLARALRVLAEMGWPVMLHGSEPLGHAYPGKGSATPMKLWRLLSPALAGPHPRICLAHLGGGLPLYAAMPEVLELCRQLYFDTAAIPFLYRPGVLAQVDRLLGPGRLCFGSDFPLLPPERYRPHLEALSQTARRQLLGPAGEGWLSGATASPSR